MEEDVDQMQCDGCIKFIKLSMHATLPKHDDWKPNWQLLNLISILEILLEMTKRIFLKQQLIFCI